MFARILTLVATLLIFHAAFSTYEHLSYLKALERPEGPIPTEIVIETLVALALGIVGASIGAPPLQEITWASEMRKRSIDDMDSRLGFADYVTRGRALFTSRKVVPGQPAPREDH
ncbi:hypothetical protein NMY22_g7348 [Coprinellus aureogranulatus]|nr:hypothetical protein NMY22_g7348 [Coprinellus aureogranulatus]